MLMLLIQNSDNNGLMHADRLLNSKGNVLAEGVKNYIVPGLCSGRCFLFGPHLTAVPAALAILAMFITSMCTQCK